MQTVESVTQEGLTTSGFESSSEVFYIEWSLPSHFLDIQHIPLEEWRYHVCLFISLIFTVQKICGQRATNENIIQWYFFFMWIHILKQMQCHRVNVNDALHRLNIYILEFIIKGGKKEFFIFYMYFFS